MLGLGGVLGISALGLFELGIIQTGSTFVPHRGKARGSLTGNKSRGTLRGAGARSRISSTTIGSEEG